MTEKVYDSHHGLTLKLRDQRLQLRANLNFTHDALKEMRFEFQKATFWRKLKKTGYFQIIASAVCFHVF